MYSSYVYKRCRLQNSIALLPTSHEANISHQFNYSNSSDGSKFNLLTLSEGLSSRQRELHGKQRESLNAYLTRDLQRNHPPSEGCEVHSDGNTNLQYTSIADVVESSHKQKDKDASGSYENIHHVTVADHNFGVKDSCSSTMPHLEQYSSSSKAEGEDMGECSSSEVIVSEPPSGFSSSRELCVHFLRWCGEDEKSYEVANDRLVSNNLIMVGDTASFHLPCNICGQMGSPQNMLICDLCEVAFHLSCCREKGPFGEEWYCQPCSRKNPRPLLDAVMGRSFTSISEEYKRRILQKELGPIQFMLNDIKPYTSGVRIGKDFQAEIPEWSDSTADYHDSFGEPLPLNLADCSHPNGLNMSRSSRLDSIGNWLQCREVICNMDKHNNRVLCGKWRRAPLFVTQSDDWNCSCAVVWDPIHADCAVPQELATEEVLKQLKFVEMLRIRLGKKRAFRHIDCARR